MNSTTKSRRTRWAAILLLLRSNPYRVRVRGNLQRQSPSCELFHRGILSRRFDSGPVGYAVHQSEKRLHQSQHHSVFRAERSRQHGRLLSCRVCGYKSGLHVRWIPWRKSCRPEGSCNWRWLSSPPPSPRQKRGPRGRAHQTRQGSGWRVEPLFAWLHHFRRLVIRWEYHVENFFGMVRLGCMKILFRYL
jgi:hypothetical protein